MIIVNEIIFSIIFTFFLKLIPIYIFKNKYKNDLERNKTLIRNFSNYFFHTFSATITFITLYNKYYDVRNVCIVVEYPIKHARIIYMIQGVYYLMELFDFEYFNKKDWWVILNHHIVTLLLLSISYNYMLVYIGLKIILLHDISDIFLYLSKLINTLNYQNRYKKYKIISFSIFVISFIILRLGVLPFYLIYGCYVERDPDKIIYSILILFLLMLVVMHIVWSSYIVALIKLYIKTGDIKKDNRD